MDSKYNCIESSSSTPHFNSFNVKKKLPTPIVLYSSSSISAAKKLKKSNSNDGVYFTKGLSGGSSSSVGSSFIAPHISIEDQRKQLPVYQVKSSLIKKIIQNKTLIIIGETGSGKTTQIPQYLHEAGLTEKGLIAITQPRRVAAITISKRVAQEQQCKLGETVGYTVRFEDVTSRDTKIKYMTDGSLLREALSDKLLKNYRVILLDEAHERTINTDILLGIVKEAQKIRNEKKMIPLKIIVMSATMDIDYFSNYFGICEPIYLGGRMYPIKVYHTKDSQTDYQHACLSTLFDIHKTAPANDDVLIFLTGQDEIVNMARQIRSIAKTNDDIGPPIRVFPLYSQLPQMKQLDVFHPLQHGTRKVVLSTNIAETSLTIKGIKYVIDSGVVKRKIYDSITGMDILKVVKISQDQAWQRTGRAGRDSPGFCYRTYTMADYKKMPMTSTPEILRSNVTATVLQLLALEINCQKFDFIEKPSQTDIEMALKQLYLLGAIKSVNSDELTSLGRRMAKFPLDPRFSKMLLVSSEYECLNEMASIVSVLSGENIYDTSIDEEKRADAITAYIKFESIYGDHLSMLNIFNAFMETQKTRTMCNDNFLNHRNLSYALDIRKQLLEICERLDIPQSTCGTNLDQVRKCLVSGLFNNVAEIQRDNQYMVISSRQKIKIHPSSVLINKQRPPCVVFTELVSTSQNYIRCVTAIEPEWIEEMVPNCGFVKKLSMYS